MVLLIANSKYNFVRKDKPTFKDLEQPEKDTDNFEEFLTQYLGVEDYHVTYLKNPTKRVVDAVIKRATQKMKLAHK